jgi:hypothetical protein
MLAHASGNGHSGLVARHQVQSCQLREPDEVCHNQVDNGLRLLTRLFMLSYAGRQA